MAEWSGDFLRSVLDAAPEGIVICEAGGNDAPVVYVNAAFERLSGYAAAELLGQDLRQLQSWDREQDGRTQVRQALSQGESCRVLLRNYRKDGAQFWNELLIQPMRGDGGAVTHYIGFHRDVSERERSALRRAPGLPTWLREDRLSGLCSRQYFEELLQHDWQIGIREARVLTLLVFDIDELGSYNDTFGRAAGDACIRRIAGIIGAAFRRGSDVVARWDGGRIAALVRNPDVATLANFATAIQAKVLEQHIHHPRARRQKFVTVSVAAAVRSPSNDSTPEMLIQATMQALTRAKNDRGNRVVVVGPTDAG